LGEVPLVALTSPFLSMWAVLMPIMLLRRDVMVGFLGLSSASAAACTLLAPDWLTTGWGRTTVVSGCEWTEEAVEAEADGEPADLSAVLGGLLVVGAAMFPAFRLSLAGAARKWCGSFLWGIWVWRRRCLAGKKPRCCYCTAVKTAYLRRRVVVEMRFGRRAWGDL